MNKLVIISGFAVAMFGAGCMSTASWRDEETEAELNYEWQKTQPGGHWKVTSFNYVSEDSVVDADGDVATKANDESAQRERDILEYVKHHGEYQEIFKEKPEYKSIPVALKITVKEGDLSGGCVATLNNCLSACTLTIWPGVWTDSKEYKIEAQYPNGKLERTIVIDRRQFFSILPLGLLPVPAFADKGSRGSGTAVSVAGVYRNFENEVLRKQMLRFLNMGQYIKETQILDKKAKQ